MTSDGERFSEENWSFALQLYAKPGVAQACLRLQSAANVDVMFLLAVLFAATQKNISLSAGDLEALDEAVRPWREQVIHPLRALRTALKSGPAPAPNAETEKLRSRIKADELHAEQIEGDLLSGWLRQRPRATAALTTEQVGEILGAVVKHFTRLPPAADVSSDLAVLLGAVTTSSS